MSFVLSEKLIKRIILRYILLICSFSGNMILALFVEFRSENTGYANEEKFDEPRSWLD